ncbi:hypothetical protein [Vibrio algivorus]|uniref:Uncharacterized protein n=1 Tax=Vibrio algivorus TaxID=1667024 RepID=A0ABQ6ELA6_9VIBR|nr:hypothetical protein [Vibrio algivorus]GLT13870.1 hypothetical protein GCM10007931_08440 [Vibrio algivorus]
MKIGHIDKFQVPVAEVINITAPIQIEIRRDGGWEIKTLKIAGNDVDCFRGLIYILEDKQREYEESQKKKTPHTW